MTLFGQIWQDMVAAGEAPRESLFQNPHSPEWYAAREECERRTQAERQRRKEKKEGK